MVRKILCVAEKSSIAKAVANHLSGGSFNSRNIPGYTYGRNYEFNYDFGPPIGHCNVVFTCVAGHLQELNFPPEYKGWESRNPIELFEARVFPVVNSNSSAIAKNIEQLARSASLLYIWTDCDREGEKIGVEIRDIALKVKPSLQVKRASFSNIERAHIIQAARNPIELDERAAAAVQAREELDLRIGASYTRFLTSILKGIVPSEDTSKDKARVVSYGSCQFPTLGFVVDRYWKVQNFIPEPFWKIVLKHKKQSVLVEFNWQRVRLFDRALTAILLERCVGRLATVRKVDRKRKTKWRPLPLTTVELQKCGTMFLRMDSKKIMSVAEKLYQQGFISYPRTETDQFDKGMDLKAIVNKQTQSQEWGEYAQGLLDGRFQQPRNGSHNDKAHPPIHPVNFVAPTALSAEEREVYKFVVRRFLACCSADAVGEQSTVEIVYGGPGSDPGGKKGVATTAPEGREGEIFTASGLIVLERNYLDVYPYEKWISSAQLPQFTEGEQFFPTEANLFEGTTTAPKHLTEPELISLMDANGIGTDATMADHIAKIKDREYVIARPSGGGRGGGTARGRGRGGRGRGGRGGSDSQSGDGGSGNGVLEFIPTKLGCGIIAGYEKLNMDKSLSKPFLRRETESQLKQICEGILTREAVVRSNIELYREIYARSVQGSSIIKDSVRRFMDQN